jgi:hypothetical protein
MVVEIIVEAPNGESDRDRIFKLFEDDGYFVRKLELKTFLETKDTYFVATVEQSDTFKQD